MSLSLESTIANFNSTRPILAELSEVDPETCRLLGPFALVVQAIMGFLVVGSLLLKRTRESPKRKWRVWIADLSKQVLGQAFVHGSNVLISDQIASHKSDNPCSLYFINIAIDTTFGVLLLYAFLLFFTSILLIHYPNSFKTGYYGNPFSISIWWRQAAVYVACLGLMKVVVVGLFWIFPDLFRFGNWALSWVTNDDAQVVFVMLIFPLVMNVLQFLIIDSFLKSKSTSPNLNDITSLEEDEQDEEERGFLDPPEVEDEDDHHHDQNSPSTLPSYHSNSQPSLISSTPVLNTHQSKSYNSIAGGGSGNHQQRKSLGGGAGDDQFIIDDDEEEEEDEDELRTPTTTTNNINYNSYPPTSSVTTTPTKLNSTITSFTTSTTTSNTLLESKEIKSPLLENGENNVNNNNHIVVSGLEWEK